jgi:DNA polymerase-3 subunit chi
MPKVDFYVLPNSDPQARLRLACRIAEKAYSLGHQVHIRTDSKENCQQLDILLWTFRDRSFIPHEIEPESPQRCKVTLGCDWTPAHCQILINLASDAPTFFDRFERVAEIIDQAPDARDAGRARYRFYRERGCELRHHEVAG